MRKKHFRRKDILNKDTVKYGKVFLTTAQVEKLKANYGEDLIKYAIQLLNEKIISNPHDKKLCNAKNHYQYFRSDGKIINFALEMFNNVKSYGHIWY